MASQEALRLARAARAAGFSGEEIPMMVAIGLGESSGDPRAYNPNASTGDNSYGLWQINMLGDMGPERREWFGISSNEDLFDPITNARAARKLYEARGNFNDWSVYKRGDYKKFLDEANEAARAVGAEPLEESRTRLSEQGFSESALGTRQREQEGFRANPYRSPVSALDQFVKSLSPLTEIGGVASPVAQNVSPLAQDRESVLASLGMGNLPFAIDRKQDNIRTAGQTDIEPSFGQEEGPMGSSFGADVLLGLDQPQGLPEQSNRPPNQGFRTRRPSPQQLLRERPTVGGDIR